MIGRKIFKRERVIDVDLPGTNLLHLSKSISVITCEYVKTSLRMTCLNLEIIVMSIKKTNAIKIMLPAMKTQGGYIRS